MTMLSSLCVFIAIAGLSILFQAVTGHPALFQFAPAGAEWWTNALDVLLIFLLATVVLILYEWFHTLSIRYYGGKESTVLASHTTSHTRVSQPTTSSPAISSSLSLSRHWSLTAVGVLNDCPIQLHPRTHILDVANRRTAPPYFRIVR